MFIYIKVKVPVACCEQHIARSIRAFQLSYTQLPTQPTYLTNANPAQPLTSFGFFLFLNKFQSIRNREILYKSQPFDYSLSHIDSARQDKNHRKEKLIVHQKILYLVVGEGTLEIDSRAVYLRIRFVLRVVYSQQQVINCFFQR